MSASTFGIPGSTRFLVLNPDGTPNASDFNISAAQVTGLSQATTLDRTTVANILPAVVGASGGGPTNLDGVTTVGLPNDYTVLIREAGHGLTGWVLEPDSTDGTGVRNVVPLDHVPGTNARTWRQRL